MNRILDGISRVNTALGHLAAWLILIMVLCQFCVVVLRYVFGVGSLILQESVVYMFGASFMLGAALVLIEDGHVRVDIFYQGATKRWQNTIDFWGSLLLLLPVSAVIFWTSLPYVALSWTVLEGSQETSGIPGVFLFKTIIPIFAAQMFLQGFVMAVRSYAALKGK